MCDDGLQIQARGAAEVEVVRTGKWCSEWWRTVKTGRGNEQVRVHMGSEEGQRIEAVVMGSD